jgi:hypothetical protein
MEWKLRDCLDHIGLQELLDVVDDVLPVSAIPAASVTCCNNVVFQIAFLNKSLNIATTLTDA